MKGYGGYLMGIGLLCLIAWGNANAQRQEIVTSTADLEDLCSRMNDRLSGMERDQQTMMQTIQEHKVGRWSWSPWRSPFSD